MILCDRADCEAIADDLEIEDDGTEHRPCSFHTRARSTPRASPHHYQTRKLGSKALT